MQRTSRFLFILFSLLILGSCSEEKVVQKPEGLIEEEIFSDIMFEMMMIENYKKKFSKKVDSMETKLQGFYLELFDEHGTTRERFDASFEYYNATPDKMKSIIEKTEYKIKTQEDKLKLESSKKKKKTIDDNIQKNNRQTPGKRGIYNQNPE